MKEKQGPFHSVLYAHNSIASKHTKHMLRVRDNGARVEKSKKKKKEKSRIIHEEVYQE